MFSTLCYAVLRMILFEYPLHERTRLFLRLENCLARLHTLIESPQAIAHQAAMQVLLELLEIIAGRGDIKSELSQELDKQRTNLLPFLQAPGVNTALLQGLLNDIEHAYGALVNWQQRPGQHLRDNEWFNAIKARSTVPGGMCEFDLPNYHRWLAEPDAQRKADFALWLQPLQPLIQGLTLSLKLLRQTGEPFDALVPKGQLQIDIRSKPYNLMRIWIAPELAAVPEISASKFVVWVRLMAQSTTLKSALLERDVPLQVALCSV